MPSLSFLKQFYNERQSPEVKYLQVLNRDTSVWHGDLQGMEAL